MFHRLTIGQRGIIEEICRTLHPSNRREPVGRVEFLGLDQNELPVVRFTDRLRTVEAFAIPRSTYRRGAVVPAYPLRWFTDTELDNMSSADVEILMGLCVAQAPSSTGSG